MISDFCLILIVWDPVLSWLHYKHPESNLNCITYPIIIL